MNKKKIVVFTCGTLFLLGIFYYFFFKKSSVVNDNNQAGVGVAVPAGGYFPVGIQQENRVIYQKIQSFVKTAKPRGAPRTYLVSEYPEMSAPSAVPDYSIVYFEDKTTFVITIYKRPLSDTRIKAEQDLLQKIGISEKEACNLNVNLGTIASVDENMSGKNFGLSFCPNGISFPSEQ